MNTPKLEFDVGSISNSAFNDPVSQKQELNVGSVSQSVYSDLQSQKYNPQKHLDRVRAHATYVLLSIFFLTILIPLIILFWKSADFWTSAKDMIHFLLTAETGLIGSVIGFYFGSQVGEARAQQTPQ